MANKELENRKLVTSTYLKNPKATQRSIAKACNLTQSTVNYILKRYKETLTVERKAGSGGARTNKYKTPTQGSAGRLRFALTFPLEIEQKI